LSHDVVKQQFYTVFIALADEEMYGRNLHIVNVSGVCPEEAQTFSSSDFTAPASQQVSVFASYDPHVRDSTELMYPSWFTRICSNY